MKKANSKQPENLTPQEAMAILRCGRTTLWQLTSSGQLPSIKLARKILIPRNALNAFIKSKTQQTPAVAS